MYEKLVIAAAALVAVAAYCLYRVQQRRRVLGIGECVRSYLQQQYGELPNDISINCSDDSRWPILVSFAEPQGGARRQLQFKCSGPLSSFRILADA